MNLRAAPRWFAAALLLAAALSSWSGAAGAGAAEPVNRPFLPESSFDGGEVPGGQIEDACGVASSPADGDIFVADYYHHAVDVFGPSPGSGYLSQIKLPALDGPCALAVGAGGDLFVDDYHGQVTELTPAEFFSGSGHVIDTGHESTGVAVDPAGGDIYVDDRNRVAEYEPSGALLATIGLGSLEDGYGVAVSDFAATAGDLYVADGATDTVEIYDPAISLSEPVGQIDGAGTPQGAFDSLHDSSLAVDQTDGQLLVADDTQPGFEHPAAVVDIFNAAGLYRGQLPHAIIDGEPVGLAVAGSGEVLATSGNWQDAGVLAFGPAGPGETLEVLKGGTGAGTIASEPAGISCGSACAAEFDSGATVTLSATPAAGSVFATWSGCPDPGGDRCTLTLSAARSVEAKFEPAPAPALSTPAATPAFLAAPQEQAAPLGKLTLRQVSGTATGATLAAAVSGPGTLSATGTDLRSLAVRAGAGGSTALRLILDRTGRRALARSKSHRLSVLVTVTFSPTGGGPVAVARRTVTFKSMNGGP